MFEQAREPLTHAAGLQRAEVFGFLQREQGVAGLDDPFAQRQAALRLQ